MNELINTILINQEININDAIKRESEYLKTLLIIKQNNLMNNQINNNNMNFNPFMFQSNPLMIVPPIYQMNNHPINIGNSRLEQNNTSNNCDSNIVFINVIFSHLYGIKTTIVCKPDEKIWEMVKKYREKSNDYEKIIFS